MPVKRNINHNTLLDDALHPSRSLVCRKRASQITGFHISTLKRLEKAGRLTAVRPTGPRGNVFYWQDQIIELINPIREDELVE